MTADEAEEFVSMIDGAWQPSLTDVQRPLWRNLVRPLDAHIAFRVLMRLFKSDEFRLKPPEFMVAYRRELINSTPATTATPQDRDELPEWVAGWRLARGEGDDRFWPEQERGFRELHEQWLEDVGQQRHRLIHKRGQPDRSGYEWDQLVAERRIMPQEDRLEYMRRAREMDLKASELAEMTAISDEMRPAILSL